MEAEVLTVRREMSNEYRRRLDALEAEWAARAASRATELEAAHGLKLQQVRVLLTHVRLERLEKALHSSQQLTVLCQCWLVVAHDVLCLLK
jgi:hypothetical protein